MSCHVQMEVQRLVVLQHSVSRSAEGSSVDLELLNISDDTCERAGQRHAGMLSDAMSWGIVRRYIQNILDWGCHLYNSCGSAKHR
jgi:hypothetical protein